MAGYLLIALAWLLLFLDADPTCCTRAGGRQCRGCGIHTLIVAALLFLAVSAQP